MSLYAVGMSCHASQYREHTHHIIKPKHMFCFRWQGVFQPDIWLVAAIISSWIIILIDSAIYENGYKMYSRSQYLVLSSRLPITPSSNFRHHIWNAHFPSIRILECSWLILWVHICWNHKLLFNEANKILPINYPPPIHHFTSIGWHESEYCVGIMIHKGYGFRVMGY